MEVMWPEAERIRRWARRMRHVLDKFRSRRGSCSSPPWKRSGTHGMSGGLAAEVVERFEGSILRPCGACRKIRRRAWRTCGCPAHRKHVRTTNLVGRRSEEERRRAKVPPPFRSERECLKLVRGCGGHADTFVWTL